MKCITWLIARKLLNFIIMTALQEVIDYLQFNIDNCEEFGLPFRGIYFDCKWRAEEALQKEKQQIESAFENGRYNAYVDNPDADITGKQYYEKEFKNKLIYGS